MKPESAHLIVAVFVLATAFTSAQEDAGRLKPPASMVPAGVFSSIEPTSPNTTPHTTPNITTAPPTTHKTTTPNITTAPPTTHKTTTANVTTAPPTTHKTTTANVTTAPTTTHKTTTANVTTAPPTTHNTTTANITTAPPTTHKTTTANVTTAPTTTHKTTTANVTTAPTTTHKTTTANITTAPPTTHNTTTANVTTAPPTTHNTTSTPPTPKPEPTPPTNITVGNYTVKNGNKLCVMVQAAIQVHVNNSQVQAGTYIVPGSAEGSGNCESNSASLMITLKEGYISMNFIKNDTTNMVFVSAVAINLTYAFKSGVLSHLERKNESLQLFSMRTSHSYSCKSESVFLGSGTYLMFSKDRMQAFNLTSSQFGPFDLCKPDQPDYRVAIGVGVVLLILIIIVIIAYLISRRKRTDGYQSL